MTDTTAAKTETLTPDEQQVKARRILQDYLESRGWAEATPFGYSCEYGEADYVCRDPESDEVVLISLDYTFDLDAEPHAMPTLEIDELDRENAKCTALSYVARHPGTTSVRFDKVALLVWGECQGTIRHLVGLYSACDL